MSFVVMIEENSHFADGEGRYRHGEFSDVESALAACRRIIDEFMELQHRPGMTAETLYELYTHFGEEPYVVGPERCEFSAREYVRRRSAEVAGDDI